jgi:hypothetical protein
MPARERRPITANPPITPPTIAPTFVDDFPEDGFEEDVGPWVTVTTPPPPPTCPLLCVVPTVAPVLVTGLAEVGLVMTTAGGPVETAATAYIC